MQKHDRISPAASGRSHRSLCTGFATASSRCMLPSSGANTFNATGPSGEYPASSNAMARPKCDSAMPPYSRRHVRRQKPRRARLGDQLLPQFVGGPVRRAPGIRLHGNDLFGDESPNALLEVLQFR